MMDSSCLISQFIVNSHPGPSFICAVDYLFDQSQHCRLQGGYEIRQIGICPSYSQRILGQIVCANGKEIHLFG